MQQQPPPRNLDVRAGVSDICPECKSQDTTMTLKSDSGVYCRCANCGHIWHQTRTTH